MEDNDDEVLFVFSVLAYMPVWGLVLVINRSSISLCLPQFHRTYVMYAAAAKFRRKKKQGLSVCLRRSIN